MKKDFDNIKTLYQSLKSKRGEYLSLWTDIAEHTGLVVDPQAYEGNSNIGNKRLDEYVDDPTSALSVTMAGEYLNGIIWGLGDAFELVPTDNMLEMMSLEELSPYYKWATRRVLEQLNHPESGIVGANKAYFYDQYAFGTSGVGLFLNPKFKTGAAENAIIARNYGVDNTAIDEGINGLVEYIFIAYNWNVSRIVGEFAKKGDTIDKALLAMLPKDVVDAWNNNDINKKFKIVHGIYPREDYNPRLKGKRGAKYVGVWFYDDKESKPFAEEDYETMPIAMCRQTKIRGEVYGRSAGTILISSIKTVNYMVGQVIEIMEKMNDPTLGMYNNALVGDSVLDTSSKSLLIFNESMLGNAKQPIFPVYDVGDPTGIINYLIPYLNEKISSAFKIDMLIDFNSKANMTASESTQRYIIRGQALSGLLLQQLTEFIYPLARRAVSLLRSVDYLGIDANKEPQTAKQLEERQKGERIIPAAVLDAIKNGKQWFKVQPSDRVRKLMQTEKLEALMTFLNHIAGMASINPSILMAVDFYGLLKDIATELNIDISRLVGDKQYKAILEQQAQMQQQMMQMEQMKVGASAGKDVAQGRKLANEVNSR